MRHKLLKLILLIIIATFLWQSLAWEQAKGEAVLTGVRTRYIPLSPSLRQKDWRISLRLKNGNLRPRAVGEKATDGLTVEKARAIVEELCGDENMKRRLDAARFLKEKENYKKIRLPRRVDVDMYMHSYHSDGYQTPQ